MSIVVIALFWISSSSRIERRRGRHRRIRERSSDAALDHAERIAELFAGRHLIDRLARPKSTRCISRVSETGERNSPDLALLQHLIDEFVAHVFRSDLVEALSPYPTSNAYPK